MRKTIFRQLIGLIFAFVLGATSVITYNNYQHPAVALATYDQTRTGAQWQAATSQYVNQLNSAIQQGYSLYQQWSSVTYGLTQAQIEALPQFSGWTNQNVTDITYALGVFNTLNAAMNNTAIAATPMNSYITPFLLSQ